MPTSTPFSNALRNAANVCVARVVPVPPNFAHTTTTRVVDVLKTSAHTASTIFLHSRALL